MKDLNKRVGEVIRRLREQKGFTQEELAEATGIHDKYIGSIERGLYGITLEYLGKVAQGLDVSVAELVKSIYGPTKGEDEKDTLLNEIYSFLQTQSIEDLKFLRKFLIHPKTKSKR